MIIADDRHWATGWWGQVRQKLDAWSAANADAGDCDRK